MTSSVKAAIAYIAGTLISGKHGTNVYDYSSGQYVLFSGNIAQSNINVFDYTHSCYITGNGSGSSYSLFHYGESSHLQLHIAGNQFNGFDYGRTTLGTLIRSVQ